MRKKTRLPSGSTRMLRVTASSTSRTLGRYLLGTLVGGVDAPRSSSAASAAGAELVADAMDRLDNAVAARLLELHADVPDVAVHGAVRDVHVEGVGGLDQAVAVAHVLRPLEELPEDGEFGGGERHRPLGVAGRVLGGAHADEQIGRAHV